MRVKEVMGLLKQGEFIAFADGKDKKVQFKLQHIQKEMPENKKEFTEDELRLNYQKIYQEAQSLFVK